jgi:arylsulfatase
VERFDEFLSVKDLAPTVLDLAGISSPGGKFQGRDVELMQGRSMKSVLEGAESQVHDADYVMGWEMMGQQALRKGDWKIVLAQPPLGDRTWQLYNVANDPSESEDKSKQHPEIFKDLMSEWENYVVENGVQVRSHQ